DRRQERSKEAAARRKATVRGLARARNRRRLRRKEPGLRSLKRWEPGEVVRAASMHAPEPCQHFPVAATRMAGRRNSNRNCGAACRQRLAYRGSLRYRQRCAKYGAWCPRWSEDNRWCKRDSSARASHKGQEKSAEIWKLRALHFPSCAKSNLNSPAAEYPRRAGQFLKNRESPEAARDCSETLFCWNTGRALLCKPDPWRATGPDGRTCNRGNSHLARGTEKALKTILSNKIGAIELIVADADAHGHQAVARVVAGNERAERRGDAANVDVHGAIFDVKGLQLPGQLKARHVARHFVLHGLERVV